MELVKKFLTLDGVSYFLSNKLNQDPLEEHFGRQRACGGANDNPTLEQYAQNEKKLLVAKVRVNTCYARKYERTTRRWKTD